MVVAGAQEVGKKRKRKLYKESESKSKGGIIMQGESR